jgi:hypothetical protein
MILKFKKTSKVSLGYTLEKVLIACGILFNASLLFIYYFSTKMILKALAVSKECGDIYSRLEDKIPPNYQGYTK